MTANEEIPHKNCIRNNLVPLVDQIALPDFNAGAMENWGLITYRETALLYDEKYSSNSNKERIATIIAHELAHMVSFELCKLHHFTLSFSWRTLLKKQTKKMAGEYYFKMIKILHNSV